MIYLFIFAAAPAPSAPLYRKPLIPNKGKVNVIVKAFFRE
jgi:hypothetical protein